MIIVEVNQVPIALYQLLKLADVVTGGGEAKILIINEAVTVNGEVVTQKRKKLFPGDIVECDGQTIQLALIDESYNSAPQQQPKRVANENEASVSSSKPKRRKPIAF